MELYEWLTLLVSFLTLVVLFWTLCHVRRYVADTKTLADSAVEQLPRPCVVLGQYSDSSMGTVCEGQTTSLMGGMHMASPLVFANVGTGPAVNCRYSSRDVENEEQEEVKWWLIPEIGPQDSFKSEHILNSLSGDSLSAVSIQYESVGGSRYQTDLVILKRKWAKESKFVKLPDS